MKFEKTEQQAINAKMVKILADVLSAFWSKDHRDACRPRAWFAAPPASRQRLQRL